MPVIQRSQVIEQLEQRKGGYFYLHLNADEIDRFEKKRKTRLVCEIDDTVKYSCGLNHLGNGDFFIIVAVKHLKTLKKTLGDEVQLRIYEDPDPLGVKIPEVLQVLMEQDESVKAVFDRLTDGKKRSLIYSIHKIKDIDLQVKKTYTFINGQALRRS